MEDTSLEFRGYTNHPSKLIVSGVMEQRQWLLAHKDSLLSLDDRNADILALRFGLHDNIVRSMGYIAFLYELNLGTICDIVGYSIGDAKREYETRQA